MASNGSALQFYENFSQYPRSYDSGYHNERSIEALEKKLAQLAGKIFDKEEKSYVDFVETDGRDQGRSNRQCRIQIMLTEHRIVKFVSSAVQGSQDLQSHLLPTVTNTWSDPKCRFV